MWYVSMLIRTRLKSPMFVVYIGEPSREILYYPASWLHLAQPKLTLYVSLVLTLPIATNQPQGFHVCTSNDGPCFDGVEMNVRLMSTMAGQSNTIPPLFPRPVGATNFPLAASCARCKEESTGAVSFKMSRCAGCKLTRCVLCCFLTDYISYMLARYCR